MSARDEINRLAFLLYARGRGQPMSDTPRQGCQFVRTWEPLDFCGTEAKWRYEAMGGGHMYLCDDHAIKHFNQVEAAPPEGWPHVG